MPDKPEPAAHTPSTVMGLGANLAPSAHSREEFERAHQRLKGWMIRLFLENTGHGRDVADELSQRAWSLIWQAVSSGRYDPQRAALTTFAYGVAHNVLRQWQQGRLREQRRESLAAAAARSDLATSTDGLSDVGDLVADAERVDLVRSCLRGQQPDSGLSAGETHLLRLLSQGLTDRELAVELDISPSTANARKRSAMAALSNYLTKMEEKRTT